MGMAPKVPTSSPTIERILDGDGTESACSVSDRHRKIHSRLFIYWFK